MTEDDPAVEGLLEYLRDTRGFDLTGYKRSSLVRRIGRRMEQVGITDYGDYLDRLQVHADEFTELFNTILINVTGFFRDADAWATLSEDVLPELLSAKPAGEPIRIWSAGCASGQEAYTLAILLCDLLGDEDFKHRVKIYATDVDEEALAQARHATYSASEVRGMSAERLETYFEKSAGRFVFRKDLRRSVIFGRNDLVQDAPISRIDLLVCRNTLMYFNAETQARVLHRFHFALADSGALFLGKAEMLLSQSTLFVPVHLKRRIFRKVRRPVADGTLLADLPGGAPRASLPALDLLQHEALMTGPLAQIVVSTDGRVAMANRQAEHMFGVSSRDVGRPFRDLDLSYRPAELRGYIEQAMDERRTVRVPDATHLSGGDHLRLQVQVTPLTTGDNGLLGVSIVFHDVTGARRLQDELEMTNRQLETAYEELQSTNEELETTNEELQSTVEELETMNEELQSTNDELQTINDELQARSSELDRANEFLAAILANMRAGVVVLNRELQVQVWNRQAEELWGLRHDEAYGRHFLNLDIGLPVDRLRPLIKQTLADVEDDGASQGMAVPAVNRRGRSIGVKVLGSPLRDAAAAAVGVILMMEEDDDAVGEAGRTAGSG